MTTEQVQFFPFMKKNKGTRSFFVASSATYFDFKPGKSFSAQYGGGKASIYTILLWTYKKKLYFIENLSLLFYI